MGHSVLGWRARPLLRNSFSALPAQGIIPMACLFNKSARQERPFPEGSPIRMSNNLPLADDHRVALSVVVSSSGNYGGNRLSGDMGGTGGGIGRGRGVGGWLFVRYLKNI